MSVSLSSSLTLFFLATGLAVAQNTLTVAAASDLSMLGPELAQGFEKTNPTGSTIKVTFVNQASGMLAQQIENGAPYDVFLSANAQFVDRLVASGKLKPGAVTYAIGRVALMWRDGKAHPLKDLTLDSVRFIALPNPKLAPYGVAAQQALEHEHLWQKVQPKLVYGENVRQTLQLFDSGNADAVLTSDGLINDRHPELIPASWHEPIIQKAGVVSASARQNEANLFVQFLLGPTAQAIFARHGFGKP
jgi:molybdate transport system substrate-binding protein